MTCVVEYSPVAVTEVKVSMKKATKVKAVTRFLHETLQLR